MFSTPRFLPPLLALLLIAGCAGPSGYPSLQPRPIEKLSLAEPSVAPPQSATVTPELADRYRPMIEQARSADADFRKILAEERGRIALGRGAAFGSDAWTNAQESLSRVEAARAPIAAVLADLDAARDTDQTRADTAQEAAAMQAYEKVQQMDADEARSVAALKGRAD